MGFAGGEGGGKVVEVEAVELAFVFEEGGEEGVDGLGAFGGGP